MRVEFEPPYAETDEYLLDPLNYQRLWMVISNVIMAEADMSRYTMPDDMSLVFCRTGFVSFPFRMGELFALPDIDPIILDKKDSTRWFSHYLEAFESRNIPRRVSRRPDRLRLLSLWAKCRHPRLIPALER